jgi:hypothetical protein
LRIGLIFSIKLNSEMARFGNFIKTTVFMKT